MHSRYGGSRLPDCTSRLQRTRHIVMNLPSLYPKSSHKINSAQNGITHTLFGDQIELYLASRNGISHTIQIVNQRNHIVQWQLYMYIITYFSTRKHFDNRIC